MKLFRSENEILQKDKEKQQLEKERQEAEKKVREFYKDINFTNSEEDIKFLEKTRNFSKLLGKQLYTPDLPSGELKTSYAVTASLFLDFYILNQLSSSRKSIDALVEQNKELNNKFDMLINQNKELNDKFDQLIEILKSK